MVDIFAQWVICWISLNWVVRHQNVGWLCLTLLFSLLTYMVLSFIIWAKKVVQHSSHFDMACKTSQIMYLLWLPMFMVTIIWWLIYKERILCLLFCHICVHKDQNVLLDEKSCIVLDKMLMFCIICIMNHTIVMLKPLEYTMINNIIIIIDITVI